MPTLEYVVCYVDGLWEVRFDGHLIGGRSNKMGALQMAQALAQAGADRGERSKILVADIKGSTFEFLMPGAA